MRTHFGRVCTAIALLLAGPALRVSVAGISGADSQLWWDTTVEENDNWGSAVATGNFDGDAYMDLAVGCPAETVDGKQFAGAVRIIRGSANGLVSAGSMWISQDAFGIGETEARDNFGWCLASGDFDNDGRDDLAIGVPNEDVGTNINAGAVCVMYGTAAGLSTVGAQIWVQDSAWIHGSSESYDEFGYSLACGDFNRDNRDDLAIGTPGEDIGTTVDAGEVHIIYGDPTSGLSITQHATQDFDQNVSGVPGASEAGDRFGHSVVAGCFNNDGYYDDLAVGVPYEHVGAVADAGAVNVFYGSASGLSTTDAIIFDRNTGVIPGDATEGDRLGFAMAFGRDSGASPRSLLAIGIPGDDYLSPSQTYTNAGAVLVLRGTATGIGTGNYQFLRRNYESNAPIGESLTIGNFDLDPYVDLIMGNPRYDADAKRDSGLITVCHGRSTGYFIGEWFNWSLDSGGVAGTGAAFNGFGFVVAAGDFDGNGLDDVAVGVPGYSSLGISRSGAVSVLYASPSIWGSATDMGGGWRYLDWFGFFNNTNEPWIYHAQHGWMYAVGDSTADLWFYTDSTGWIYTSNSLYPWLYSVNLGSWLFYQVGSSSPRWFYNVNAGSWFAL